MLASFCRCGYVAPHLPSIRDPGPHQPNDSRVTSAPQVGPTSASQLFPRLHNDSVAFSGLRCCPDRRLARMHGQARARTHGRAVTCLLQRAHTHSRTNTCLDVRMHVSTVAHPLPNMRAHAHTRTRMRGLGAFAPDRNEGSKHRRRSMVLTRNTRMSVHMCPECMHWRNVYATDIAHHLCACANTLECHPGSRARCCS